MIVPERAIIPFRGTLRHMAMDDLRDLWELDRRCFADGEAYEHETLRYLLSNPQCLTRQIRDENAKLSAFALGLIEANGVGHLTTIGVSPENRRRGLARMLLHSLENGFAGEGVSTVRLEVRVGNTGAQRLYEQAGYFVAQRMERYYANGGDAWLMVKSLV
ncbi:MAG: GNAT family N-acetyltransferase [Blastocatellia bacterium]